MNEITGLLKTAKKSEENADRERRLLSGTLEEIKTMFRVGAVIEFNASGNSEFGVGDFEVFLNQRTGMFEIQLNSLYYRSSGEGVYEESCDDCALDQLGKDLKKFIGEKMQLEIEVGVKSSFYSK